MKKADVVEHLEVFDHVGLLVDRSLGIAELPFIQSSNIFISFLYGSALRKQVECLGYCNGFQQPDETAGRV
jgi:hypothetical protein